MTTTHKLYECGICNCLHPWDWNGDCRDDANRFGDEIDYADAKKIGVYCIEVLSIEDRVNADLGLRD
jgi:hypothetical protein